MSIFLLENGQLNAIHGTTFINESILERQHLQQALKQNISVIAADCLVLTEEYAEWDASRKRIDLLAIDKQANLVIIELKRTDTGDHMELQALRYASMISTMTFEHALDVLVDYRNKNGEEGFTRENARETIEDFIELDAINETNFGNDVRIILVSAEFSKELTTSVIWLNERDLDITCVRMKPYKYQDQILIDIQQVLPLPEAKDYQIRAQKKAEERREIQKNLNSKDYSKYLFNGLELNKRKLVLELIKTHIKNNNILSLEDLLFDFPQELRKGRKMYKRYDEVIQTNDKNRYFSEVDEVLDLTDGKFVISNQWGAGNIQAILDRADELGYEIEIVSDNVSVIKEVIFGEYQIQQLSNLSINISKNQVLQSVAKPILREIAIRINVDLNNLKGNEKNTRSLGSDVIQRISQMEKER
ncbi:MULTISPECIES: hypothetical protein [Acinetobacter]|jgi:hypothetical protein|uniref:DUF91 domain-containing protein n=4 Tax=Acinetobacter johnsonii TaxID=40214 RepID=A0A239RTD4_ACIJO|nr:MULTISPECIES: hypothetical protein [Acinetobacter]MBK5647749.1 hypothetical protein [Acinetobacter sp.]MBL4861259.1 hypothetical protein [Acinetobacter sp.]MCV2450275.1 hypothetical protein [Acinetobacter johnsonii]MDG9786273.1 hypothetical protein [Acinetobacter johnsonii]MDG9799306.1 hypothetical protein [Acinetobacter johnsonii]